ncbi:SsrA-binding protein SmpB [Oleidesulfovibrio alaskensis]|uniref:SsrA-binding protein SmpB n=1 Tax=Oleidesulfovibrio alaskensis TaxID=58180 RepID=UPI001A3BEEE2|nr:SsrA-binding protein SmpB [Oleidesulfovibrio alaskensis]MBL3582490.1 SsrA-binding protein SmpB [Oleidesulfovibrio alaskensis]
MTKKKSSGGALIAQNKKARHLYELLEFFEAGIALAGTEVKSLRAGQVSFTDSYVTIHNNEAWIVGMHIAPYANAGYVQHDPDRDRKLLLHAREIDTLRARVEQKGLTVVPVKLYFKNSRVKLEIAVGRGKKLHDKRQDIKQRDVERETRREIMSH